MDLQTLIREFAASGIGEFLYRAILDTVRAVVFGYSYPPSYSPTGRWDEDALTALAHDWTIDKLLSRGHMEHLLLTNETLRGFRKGLELSFRHYLIGQKHRTALDNLFQRANVLLENGPRFRLVQETGRKATRFWGLASWQGQEPYQGSDSELIAAGFRIAEVPVIRYRPDARRLSPVISDSNLTEFMAKLLDEIKASLSLEQMAIVFKYRFDLLEAVEVSLETPVVSDQEGHALLLADTIGDGTLVDEQVLAEETAAAVLRELSPRQRQVLLEYARPDATLTSVAESVGCSKSTVDNELRRTMRAIQRNAGGTDEAEAVYDRLLKALSSEQGVGNGGA